MLGFNSLKRFSASRTCLSNECLLGAISLREARPSDLVSIAPPVIGDADSADGQDQNLRVGTCGQLVAQIRKEPLGAACFVVHPIFLGGSYSAS